MTPERLAYWLYLDEFNEDWPIYGQDFTPWSDLPLPERMRRVEAAARALHDDPAFADRFLRGHVTPVPAIFREG
jgi:hypothetical protein